jgi:hypothetical protein
MVDPTLFGLFNTFIVAETVVPISISPFIERCIHSLLFSLTQAMCQTSKFLELLLFFYFWEGFKVLNLFLHVILF